MILRGADRASYYILLSPTAIVAGKGVGYYWADVALGLIETAARTAADAAKRPPPADDGTKKDGSSGAHTNAEDDSGEDDSSEADEDADGCVDAATNSDRSGSGSGSARRGKSPAAAAAPEQVKLEPSTPSGAPPPASPPSSPQSTALATPNSAAAETRPPSAVKGCLQLCMLGGKNFYRFLYWIAGRGVQDEDDKELRSALIGQVAGVYALFTVRITRRASPTKVDHSSRHTAHQ